MCKKIVTAVFIVFFFFISTTSTSALDEVNGSITVNLEEGKKGTSVENVELELIKVGDVINGQYLLINNLQDTGVNLNTLETAEDLKNTAYAISKNAILKNISGTRKNTNDYGSVKFEQLEKGIYLLQATDINKYDNISPTLISIPTFDSKNHNSMNYDIHVVPKHSPIIAAIAAKTGDDRVCVLYLCGLSVFFLYYCIKNLKVVIKKKIEK